jgi:hypothetical protein
VGIVLGAVAIIATVLLLVRPATPRSAAARPVAPIGCAQRLIHDWRDGGIDGTYRLPCYRHAMRALPTDLLVYSSAPDDIRAARSQRIVQSAIARSPRGNDRRADG